MAAWGGNHYSPLLLLYRQVDGYSTVEVNLFFACPSTMPSRRCGRGAPR